MRWSCITSLALVWVKFSSRLPDRHRGISRFTHFLASNDLLLVQKQLSQLWRLSPKSSANSKRPSPHTTPHRRASLICPLSAAMPIIAASHFEKSQIQYMRTQSSTDFCPMGSTSFNHLATSFWNTREMWGLFHFQLCSVQLVNQLRQGLRLSAFDPAKKRPSWKSWAKHGWNMGQPQMKQLFFNHDTNSSILPGIVSHLACFALTLAWKSRLKVLQQSSAWTDQHILLVFTAHVTVTTLAFSWKAWSSSGPKRGIGRG